MITALFKLLDLLLGLYVWALILSAVFSMLSTFGVLDTRNRIVYSIGEFLYRITEPVLRPIRRILPSFGNIDISPIIIIALIEIVARPLLARLYGAIVYGVWQPLVF